MSNGQQTRDETRPHRFPVPQPDGDVISWKCRACGKWCRDSEADGDCPVNWPFAAGERDVTRNPNSLAAMKRRQQRAKRAVIGGPLWVPADIVKFHLSTLVSEYGMTQSQIAEAAGVDRWTVKRILAGRSRRHTYDTGHALLSVGPSPREDLRHVSAVGTVRRLEGLQYDGWPLAWIARRTGVGLTSLQRLKADGMARRTTAAKIQQFADRAAIPPTEDRYDRQKVAMVRNRSRRLGYAPLAAWEDIDDPACRPAGVRSAA